LSRFLAIPGGRRAKWIVFAAWLVAMFAMIGGQLPAKFSDAEENESTSFLPGDAESTKALIETERLQGGEQAAIVIVYRRDGGLTQADQQRIAEDREALNEAIATDKDT
jgi:RND superfamily putative drug exporter